MESIKTTASRDTCVRISRCLVENPNNPDYYYHYYYYRHYSIRKFLSDMHAD